MNVWEWFSTTASVDSMLTTLGLGALAFLFARDLILTKGQHLRRVQDLVDHHALVLAEKETRHGETRETSDYWKEAARLERERADKAWGAVGEMASNLADVKHVLESLDRALPSTEGTG